MGIALGVDVECLGGDVTFVRVEFDRLVFRVEELVDAILPDGETFEVVFAGETALAGDGVDLFGGEVVLVVEEESLESELLDFLEWFGDEDVGG